MRAAHRPDAALRAPGRPLPVGLLRAARALPARRATPTSASPPPTSAASARSSSGPRRGSWRTAAAPPDADGWCSLSLHAAGPTTSSRARGADPDRLLVVEVSPQFPRTSGAGEHRHALHVDEIDVLVESDAAPTALPDVPATEVDRQIAVHAAAFIPDGATLQTGIGGIPSAIAAPPGGGPRRRLRHPHGDVHRRADAAAPGRQGHQRDEGPVRRRLRHDVRDGHAASSTAGSTATATSRSCPCSSSTRPRSSSRTA